MTAGVSEFRALSDDQVAAFDTEYVDAQKWSTFHACVKTHLKTDEFRVLDVGGGNGVFADRILAEFPRAKVTVLDLNESILRKNTPHPHKTLMVGSALELDKVEGYYDVVSINWVLHHLVGHTYRESMDNITRTLQEAGRLLTEGGSISIYDNLYDGLWWDRGPSRLIYALTSIRMPWVAKIVRANGANTAGVGVCFQSYLSWLQHFKAAGLQCQCHMSYTPFLRRPAVAILRKITLHMRPARPAYFWLRPAT